MRRPILANLTAPPLLTLLGALTGFGTGTACSPAGQPASAATDAAGKDFEGDVEAACGACQFEMDVEGCPLAVRIDGRAYLVEGSGIDEHGDAHAADGLCNTVRRAHARGELRGDRFIATALDLSPAKAP